MTDTHPLIFFDRSRVSLDWKCRRARWYGNEWEGLGVVPAKRALYFDIGDMLHRGFAALCLGEDLEETVRDVVEGFRNAVGRELDGEKIDEQACLMEGILRGFARTILPKILDEFSIRVVETEFLYRMGACEQGVKPDLVAERRADHTLWYWEWKTTGSIGERWMRQWNRAIQLHTTAVAVENHIGQPIQGIIVQGAFKGYEKEGRQTSIFCYGYQRPGVIGGPELGYRWKPGTVRSPVWGMEGGIKRWVENMPPEVLADQFVQTPPIFLQRRLVEAVLRQVPMREQEIRTARHAYYTAYAEVHQQAILDTFFPQNFNECEPAMGPPCPYLDCCFNPHIGVDPVASGLYNWREPHHTTDREGWERLTELRGGLVGR